MSNVKFMQKIIIKIYLITIINIIILQVKATFLNMKINISHLKKTCYYIHYIITSIYTHAIFP